MIWNHSTIPFIVPLAFFNFLSIGIIKAPQGGTVFYVEVGTIKAKVTDKTYIKLITITTFFTRRKPILTAGVWLLKAGSGTMQPWS